MNIYSIKNKGVASNIWKMVVYFVSNKRTYMTLLSIYLLTLPGSTEKTLGLVMAIGSIAAVIFEFPSGYISDRMGHKKALVLSRVCMVVSTAAYLIGGSVTVFIIGAIFHSIAWAFMSGTTTAFIQDTLVSLGREKDYAEINGKMRSVGFAVPIILIVLLPVVAQAGFRWAFLIALVVDVIGFLVSLVLVQPKVERPTEEVGIKNVLTIAKESVNTGYMFYGIITGIAMAGVMAVSPFKDPYQNIIGIPVVWLGVLWASSRVLISITLQFSGKVKKYFTRDSFIGTKILLYSILFLVLGFSNSVPIIVVAFVLVTVVSWGFAPVQTGFMLELFGASKYKASIISLKELISKIIQSGFAIVAGLIVVGRSYQSMYMWLGIVIFLVFLAFLVYPRKKRI